MSQTEQNIKPYKVGELFTIELDKRWLSNEPPFGYGIGQRVEIHEGGTLKAAFRVSEFTDTSVSGKIIATYGHKRRKQS